MLVKVYGYAENDVDVATLQAYAGVDIIAEDMEAHGQYRILRRFLREGDTLLVVRLSALGHSAEAIRTELDYLQKQEVRLRVLELPITMQELDAVSVATVYRTLQEVLMVYQQQSEEREVERSIRQQDGIQTAKKAGRLLAGQRLHIRGVGSIYWDNGRYVRSVHRMPYRVLHSLQSP